MTSGRMEKNRKAMKMGLVAGVLLLIAGITGAATMGSVKDAVEKNLTGSETVALVLVALIFLASLGGLIVIVGALMFGKDRVRLGKFLIMIGVGFGVVGLLITVFTWALGTPPTLGVGFAMTLLGLVLSIWARMEAEPAPRR